MKTRTEPCPKCRELGNDTRGDNLVVWADGGKHCFACGHKVPAPWKGPPIREAPKHYEKGTLPPDFTREVPARAWQWVLQYGLPYSHWQDYCGYSPAEERLYFCVPNISSVSFSQGRYVGTPLVDGEQLRPEQTNQDSTLLPAQRLDTGTSRDQGSASGILGRGLAGSSRSRSVPKWFTRGDCHKSAHLVGDYRQASEVVLVEDLISAHKVGKVSCAIPLFGTRVFDSVVSTLRHIGLGVVLWLDRDQMSGIQRKAANLSMLTNLPVRYIFTDNDPKSIPLTEIKELLK